MDATTKPIDLLKHCPRLRGFPPELFAEMLDGRKVAAWHFDLKLGDTVLVEACGEAFVVRLCEPSAESSRMLRDFTTIAEEADLWRHGHNVANDPSIVSPIHLEDIIMKLSPAQVEAMRAAGYPVEPLDAMRVIANA